MTLAFQGTYTAIITPFDEKEDIDEASLESLIDFNIANGISGIVCCGTTGESPTLSHDEHDYVIELSIAFAKKRVPIIAGTGSNSTREAIRLTQHAEKANADASLLVCPYYNKPTQEGMYRHFKEIANSTSLPIILYNIPGRCGINLELETLLKLADNCPNIKGIKEASGKLEQTQRTITAFKGREFYILSGDDNIALDVIKSGGHGVISVASNVMPREMSKMVSCALKEDYEEAQKINLALAPLFKAEFIETNPIPIKYMLFMLGKCKENYRLPLCELSKENKQVVNNVMKELKLV